ncbi:hypothetical protein BRC81_12100 [Halobacteriales archaeon QS_1_68_20]|nr:MAG: hypothetical protein BRC81_12100 [Halobacteriales archaeon QS_1_68_20]
MYAESLSDDVESELAAVIARNRGDDGARTMARSLLERDSKTGLLVGLLDGAESAVYYDTLTWSVRTVGFDVNGVDGLGANLVGKRRHRRDAERFVRERAADFEWIHPRFRWVL